MNIARWIACACVAVGTANADSPPSGLDVSTSRLSGLNVAPRVFTAGDRQAIGITYDWEQAFEILDQPGLAIAVRADGNVAFHADINPRDFLSTRFGIQAMHGWGGVVPGAETVDSMRANAAFRLRAAEIGTARELDDFLRSAEAAAYLSFLSPQLDLQLNVGGGPEVDQRFVEKQWAFGAGVTAELNLWGESADYNLFDYPFAVVRYLMSRDPWAVRGSTVPVVSFGYDLVSPEDDDSFGRLSAEVSFHTDLAPLSKDEMLRIGATWRGFRQLSPPDDVETAGLHEHSYVEVRMSTTKGQYVSYGEGRLPFDAVSTDSYAIGWEVDW